jgi:hypothetical protein
MNAPFDILGLAMDAIGASLPQFVVPVAFYGERKDDRKVALTAKCVVVEGSPLVMQDGSAPTRDRTFGVTLQRWEWADATPPQIGEWLRFEWRGVWMWARVESVSHMTTGDLTLSAIWNPERDGGPAWST